MCGLLRLNKGRRRRISEAAMGGGAGGRGQSSMDFIFFLGRIRSSEAAMGGGARSAPLGVAMSPKRRVRAAHGRAREAKTH